MKLGGEYIRNQDGGQWCNFCFPQLYARNTAPFPPISRRSFPVWDDLSTWNLAPLSPIVTRVRQAVSKTEFRHYAPQNMAAAWLQDDWTITSRLTLNLGVRWDLQTGANSEKVELLPWLPGDLPYDWNNVAPRLGFAFSLNDRTVLRGGYGRFYTQPSPTGRTRRRFIQSPPSRSCATTAGPILRRTRSTGRCRAMSRPLPTRATSITGRDVCDVSSSTKSTTPGAGCPTAIRHRSACSGRSGPRCRSRPIMSIRAGAVRDRLQHEPELQPGHGGQLSLLGYQHAALPRMGGGVFGIARRVVQFPRSADGLHEALQSAVAGLGHLHASRACGMQTRVHFSTDRSTEWWTGRRLPSRWRPISATSIRWPQPTSATALSSTASGMSGMASS